MKTKIKQTELLRLQKIADTISFCGYGGSKNNSRSADGDVKLIRDLIAKLKPKEVQESEYAKAIRTGIRPAIWPPIVMSREELNHFRSTLTAH